MKFRRYAHPRPHRRSVPSLAIAGVRHDHPHAWRHADDGSALGATGIATVAPRDPKPAGRSWLFARSDAVPGASPPTSTRRRNIALKTASFGRHRPAQPRTAPPNLAPIGRTAAGRHPSSAVDAVGPPGQDPAGIGSESTRTRGRSPTPMSGDPTGMIAPNASTPDRQPGRHRTTSTAHEETSAQDRHHHARHRQPEPQTEPRASSRTNRRNRRRRPSAPPATAGSDVKISTRYPSVEHRSVSPPGAASTTRTVDEPVALIQRKR